MSEDIKNSADTKFGWQSHYDRMNRWRERALEFADADLNHRSDDAVDFFLAYCLWAHSLREWLLETKTVPKEHLDRLLANQTAWNMCRDMANRSRHYNLRKKPTDKFWQLAREIDINSIMSGGSSKQTWYVNFDGESYSVSETVNQISEMWRSILSELRQTTSSDENSQTQ